MTRQKLATTTTSRRAFLGASVLALTACDATTSSAPLGEPTTSATGSRATSAPSRAKEHRMMPDEAEPHTRTWMAFVANADIWGDDLVPVVHQNLAAVANTIARFEPVDVLVPPSGVAQARKLLAPEVTIHPLEVDDLWIRDTGPTFVHTDGTLEGVDLNFNGWGNAQRHTNDAKVAAAVTQLAGATPVSTDLVLEGGALEVDGRGTALITKSCSLNENRNPGWTAADVEAELEALFGIRKVIWLPGIAGMDITDGHTDFYARFVGPGHVVAALDDDPDSFDYDVTREHLDILRSATDVAGNRLKVTTLTGPSRLREKSPGDDFAAGYINYYLCNGALIAPEFGDPQTDRAARETYAQLFPDRDIVQLNIDGIAAGGGGIHCATQQQPR